MATHEINHVESDSKIESKTSLSDDVDTADEDIIQVHALDVEADIDETKEALYKAERQELIPSEALTWDVSGDR